jgi:UDP-glucose 4-epimerase
MMTVWLIGANGLLGQSVREALLTGGGFRLFAGAPSLPWSSPENLAAAFAAGTRGLLGEAVAAGQPWAVLWCAGNAVVASPPGEIDADLAAFESFAAALERAQAEVPGASEAHGHVILASSAGGVWAGHRGGAITEATAPVPISGYGRLHLAREEVLAARARSSALRCAIVRLSNLYGPGQRLDKPQGLVSQIARAVIHRRPVHVYVPFDTIRDYLFADDAGAGLRDVLDLLRQTPEPERQPLVKILASEEEVSVGGILSLFRRISRRSVPVIAGVNALGLLQPSKLRFRSQVWAGAGRRRRTPLVEGVSRVYRHQLAQFGRGALRP